MLSAALSFPNIDPEIFRISFGGVSFALRWYALAYIVGILLGWRIALAALRRPALWPADTPPLSTQKFEDLLTWIIIGIIAGGRLGFVLFYQPAYYLTHPVEILRVWQGGMSFHGGFLGVVIVTAIFARRNRIAPLALADLLALGTPVGLMLGRIANFINGELWGRPTDLPWGVIFPSPAAQDCGSLVELCARHPSQLYEAALEGLLLGAALLWLAFRRGALKSPGRIFGLFLAGYGAARFVVEFFRLADEQFITAGNPFGHVFLGMTMGQLLSLPMILIGLAIALRARRA